MSMRIRGGGSWTCVVLCSFIAVAPVRADDEATVEAQIAKGDFAAAVRSAKEADSAERQNLLARVAAAQAKSGANGAALTTLAQVSDPAARSAFLEEAGAPGGGPQADFEALMELIRTTVAPDSWEDVGGKGAIAEFPGGVRVDAAGLLVRQPPQKSFDGHLVKLRQRAAESNGSENLNPRATSRLRMVSLTRLERLLAVQAALKIPPSESQQLLAGLQRVQYVFVYPETREIVLAGPAGDWQRDAEGRYVNVESGQPVVQLQDMVTVLRNAFSEEGRFGCSITPRQENLARTQAFLNESAKTPLKPTQRKNWIDRLRGEVGRQTIEVYGVDPNSRVAQVIVEADYRMKLVGMGLEEGVLGVKSYLDGVELDKNGRPPAMAVLRWWFTLNYQNVQSTPDRNAFELRGQGVQVLSENERLSAQGERVHTGQSEEANEAFVHGFTRQFPALADKYPVYADLRNVFDLALVAALLKAENLPRQCDWKMPLFGPGGSYAAPAGAPPREVESIVNYRVLDERHIVAGVSGGVTVDARPLVERAKIQTDDYGLVRATHGRARPKQSRVQQWWWD